MPASQPTGLLSQKQQRGKFFYLFFTQILLITLFPYLAKPGLPTILLRLLSAASFLAAVYAVSERRAQRITASVLVVPTVVLNLASALRPGLQIAIPAMIATLLFMAFTLVSLLRAVLRSETISPDTIYGALSVYLLMAFAWGVAYLLLETLHPGTLSLDSVRHPNHKIDWDDCMFYSFVTITSTGYGDMVPVTAQGRSLSVLEAVSGMMYVAVLIARLVGIYSTTNRSLSRD